MKTIKPYIWEIAYRLGMVVIAVQVLLGICWLIVNVGSVPDFVETRGLLEMSETWVMDEYVGAAYVMIIYVAKCVQSLIGIPFQILIYLLQIVIALVAVRELFGCVFTEKTKVTNKKDYRLWLASAYVNTIPFLFQAHVAVLPYSLAGSVFVLLLTSLFRFGTIMKNEEQNKAFFIKHLIRITAYWVIGTLLLPEYQILSGVFVVVFLLAILVKKRGWQFSLLAFLVAGLLLVEALSGVGTVAGSRGRVQKSFEAQTMQRLAWPYLDSLGYCWPMSVQEEFTKEEFVYYSVAPERMMEEFGPRMELAFGKELAHVLFGNMAQTSLEVNTKAVLRNLAEDFCFYLCPQLGAYRSLLGYAGTYSGQHYEMFQEKNITLSNLLTRWSACGAVVLLLLTLAGLRRAPKNWRIAFPLCLGVFIHAGYYAWTTGGMVSYLNCPVILVVWGMIPALFLRWGLKEEQIIDDCVKDN